MKQMLFLAHDPGGHDVVRPVYSKLVERNKTAKYFCVGPAATLCEEHAIAEADFFTFLNQELMLGTVSVLITGTSWGTDVELRAIRLCEEFDVPSITILDYWSNYINRLYDQNNRLVVPNYYIVMDELARHEALKEGIPEAVIRVLGHPGLDRYVNSPIELNNESSVGKVLFLSQPLSLLYGNSLGYTESSVLTDVITACKMLNLDLHVKFHPKDSPSLRERYIDLSVAGDLSEIIPQYEWIIGMSTMALLYTGIMGKHTLSYQPNLQKEDMCITNKLGFSTLIKDYSGLVDLLSRNNTEDCVSQDRPIYFDGKSTERIALFVEDVVRNGKN